MAETLHVVCPHCHSVNRLPAERLGAGGKCGACRGALFAGQPVALDQAGFERHLTRSDIPLLVDFWAPWCGPCRTMAPVFEQAARELEPALRLAKVDTEREGALAARFAIRSIPTLVLFKRGREAARLAGALQLAELLRWVVQHR